MFYMRPGVLNCMFSGKAASQLCARLEDTNSTFDHQLSSVRPNPRAPQVKRQRFEIRIKSNFHTMYSRKRLQYLYMVDFVGFVFWLVKFCADTRSQPPSLFCLVTKISTTVCLSKLLLNQFDK